jgi:hypothetical protein
MTEPNNSMKKKLRFYRKYSFQDLITQYYIKYIYKIYIKTYFWFQSVVKI